MDLRTLAFVKHQVDKWRERGNSLDWVRCSGEGCLHASEGGFRQTRHGDIEEGGGGILHNILREITRY